MKSIQQVVTEFIRDIMNLDITEGIGTYQKKGQACFNEVICRLTEARIREVDTYVYENPQSRKGWNVEQKDVSRELVTQHGTIRYERRYYRHKKSGERSYLADSLVNVAGGERIEVELAAEMCEYATEHSYEKSAQITCNGNVSRQTVMNRTRKVSGYEIDKCGTRSGTVIHIQADEDHVAMQDGRSVMPKLLAIHEPVTKVPGKRDFLPNRYLMSSYNETPQDMWERVGKEIDIRYGNLEDLKIYIHGDGASWIKSGVSELGTGRFVLDRFHVSRYIHRVTNGDIEYTKYIWERMKANDQRAIRTFVKACVDSEICAEKTGNDFLRYIRNNWSGIQIWYDPEEQAGISCAEGLVSHIYADRLSSRPRGWMDEGLTAIASLRVYVKNGGRIRPEHIRTKENPFIRASKKMKEKLRKNAHRGYDVRTAFCCARRHTPEYALYRSVKDSGMKF